MIRELSRLPGIGQKTAQRLTFHILKSDQNDVERLARSLMDIKEKTGSCTICGAITETDPCGICSDSKRDDYLICIVEDAQDIYAFEKTNSFRGKYHVLGVHGHFVAVVQFLLLLRAQRLCQKHCR